jgi:hypothetical protein
MKTLGRCGKRMIIMVASEPHLDFSKITLAITSTLLLHILRQYSPENSRARSIREALR